MVDGRFEPVPGTDFEYPADLVLLAMGFTGAQKHGLCDQLGVDFSERGTVDRDGDYATNVAAAFVAGDMGRGQSLIVWAIAAGPAAAASVAPSLPGATALPPPGRPAAMGQRCGRPSARP